VKHPVKTLMGCEEEVMRQQRSKGKQREGREVQAEREDHRIVRCHAIIHAGEQGVRHL
jgi:hypothetical protein